LRQIGGKGVFEFDETGIDEMFDLSRAQAGVFSRRHFFVHSSEAAAFAGPIKLIDAYAPARNRPVRSAGRTWT
jgi:hypothetical protein